MKTVLQQRSLMTGQAKMGFIILNKKALIINILIIFLSFVFALEAPCADNRGASIRFESYKYNFGRLGEGITVKHIFRFRNAGNKTLIIKKLKAG